MAQNLRVLSVLCMVQRKKQKTSGKLGTTVWLMLVIHSPPELTRNPDDDEKPWCYIMKDDSLSWEYCDVPSCGM